MDETLIFQPEIVPNPEISHLHPKLYHVSGWQELKNKQIGDSFTLIPGPQGAETPGVYFSEQEPRFTAAEGANRLNGPKSVIIIQPEFANGWWRSKGFAEKKFNRPRTWHSKNKEVICTIKNIEERNSLRYLDCDWRFAD